MSRTTITGRATRRFLGPTTTLTGGVGITDGGGGNVDLQVAGVTRASVTSEGLSVNGTLSVSGELSESVNGVLANPIPRTLTGPDVLRYLQASRDSCAITPGLDTVRVGPAGNGGSGAVLLRDGRLFIVPGAGTAAYIFDPSTNTMSSVGSFPSGNKFWGGCLLKDGRVFCTPRFSTYATIFDPASNSFSSPNVTFPLGDSFVGSVTLLDGRVFLCPFNSAYALLFDPSTNQLTTPDITFPSNYAYYGATLLTDGRVFLVPFRSPTTRALIFDPVTLTTTSTSASFGSGDFKYTYAVLMPDGNVFCIPHNATTARVFNPLNGEVSTPPVTFPGLSAFIGGSLTPDGRVFLAPYNSSTARIFDPVSQTLSTPSGPAFPGTGGCLGSVLLPDGRTFVTPTGTNNSRLVHTGGWGSVKLPLGVLTSPFLNKL
jgi:hypothetical protein